MYNRGVAIINKLKNSWVRNAIAAQALLAAAFGLVAGVLLYKINGASLWWCGLLFGIALVVLLLLKKPWQITTGAIVSFLNTAYPSLQESTGLLLKDSNTLNLLEQLQAERTLAALQQITMPAAFIKPLRRAALTLLSACIAGLALALVPIHFNGASYTNNIAYNTKPSIPEKILPGIKTVAVTVTPPAYTRHAVRTQQGFNIKVEEDAVVQWQVQTSAPVKTLQLLFNDSTKLLLKPGINHTQWQATKKITANGFYQVKMDSVLSEFYKIEVIKDEIPAIVITSPKPGLIIEHGEPERITINARVTDDYGIKSAVIVATTASGNGEAVKFKEQTITFPNSFGGQLQQYQLQKMIDLKAMGMQPADELYFYIKATDNNNQEKRSDIHIVTLADTASLMESDIQLGNVKLKPEYFRSERQIIIETEQLLKDKDTLSVDEFKNRANNLGIDQKLLRLRYGKFLGEEDESGEGVSNDNSALSDPGNFGNAAAVIDAYSDKHDNAEDATFLSDDVKKQLKETLTEMWKAEIRLRTFKPQEALPFEYKALRLLKDLQQKERAYVPKTTFKTTPLKPEKRLTGDLSKVFEPQITGTVNKPVGNAETIAAALGILEQLKVTPALNMANRQTLQQAMQLLNTKAGQQPAAYLTGLQAMQKILENLQTNSPVQKADINTAENALQRMAAIPAQLPQKSNAMPYNQLQQQYFKNLQKANRN